MGLPKRIGLALAAPVLAFVFSGIVASVVLLVSGDDVGAFWSTLVEWPAQRNLVNIVNYVLGAVGPIKGTIRRLGEPVQYEPELLEQLRAAGVVPGAKASFTASGSYVLVQVEGSDESLELPNEVAVHVYVGI